MVSLIGYPNSGALLRGDARPFSFDEIPRVIQGLDTQRQVKIARLEQEFSKFKAPIRLTVPAYHVGNGRFLIMDGNHRLAALALGKADFILLAFVAYGPLDPNVLPDLIHWQSR